MKSRIDKYKADGQLALKHMWFVILFFSLIQFAISVAVAQINSTAVGGYRSATFAAIWAMFLVIIFAYIGAKVSLKGSSTRLQVGFLIGAASMLSELFFLLMCYFFVLGNEAKTLGYTTMSVDNAYGVFALINTIIYLVWAIILSVRRSALNYEDGGQSDAYVPQSAESIDPSYEKSGQYRQPLADDEVRDI